MDRPGRVGHRKPFHGNVGRGIGVARPGKEGDVCGMAWRGTLVEGRGTARQGLAVHGLDRRGWLGRGSVRLALAWRDAARDACGWVRRGSDWRGQARPG